MTTPGRKSATMAVYMPGGGGAAGCRVSQAGRRWPAAAPGRHSRLPSVAPAPAPATAQRAAPTYKDAPPRPAVVPLEPGQHVAEEAKALQAGAAAAVPETWGPPAASQRQQPSAQAGRRALLKSAAGWPPAPTLTDTRTMRVMRTPRMAALDQCDRMNATTPLHTRAACCRRDRPGCAQGTAGERGGPLGTGTGGRRLQAGLQDAAGGCRLPHAEVGARTAARPPPAALPPPV